jgi:hypothetical protein
MGKGLSTGRYYPNVCRYIVKYISIVRSMQLSPDTYPLPQSARVF